MNFIIILCIIIVIIFYLEYINKNTTEILNSDNKKICQINLNYPTYRLPTNASGEDNDEYCQRPADLGKYVGILRQIQSTKLNPNKKYKVKVMNLDYAKKWINIEDAEFNYI